jgi:DegV family protein with EDD domain
VPSRIRVVTDTTAVLPPDFVAAHSIEVIPQIVRFGEAAFLEDVELSYDDFIRRLKSFGQLPKTSAPPPGAFVDVYTRLLTEAQTILSIHPSLDVSATVQSALTAKADSFPDADIRVIDTRTVAGNLATLVRLAVEWAESGVEVDEIVSRLQAMIPRGRIFFLVATLEYLQKGGRIGGASALIGSALQIKPILEIKNGQVEAKEKVRTHHRAFERLKELAIEQCPRSPGAHLCVMHADDLDEALRLADTLKSTLGFEQIPIYGVGASITTHAGPGTLAVGFFA